MEPNSAVNYIQPYWLMWIGFKERHFVKNAYLIVTQLDKEIPLLSRYSKYEDTVSRLAFHTDWRHWETPSVALSKVIKKPDTTFMAN